MIMYCPRCKRQIEATEFQGDELQYGKRLRCSNCGQVFLVYDCRQFLYANPLLSGNEEKKKQDQENEKNKIFSPFYSGDKKDAAKIFDPYYFRCIQVPIDFGDKE